MEKKEKKPTSIKEMDIQPLADEELWQVSGAETECCWTDTTEDWDCSPY
jgi:hypothetical protein